MKVLILLFCASPLLPQSLTTLASFTQAEGFPTALMQGADGNFYGTTLLDFASGGGTIFRMTPAGVVTTVYSFPSPAIATSVVQGRDGNYYGTGYSWTINDAVNNHGTIFKITAAGAWKALHNFSGADGAAPISNLIQAADGNFYGTTNGGGAGSANNPKGAGTVFKVTPDGVFTTLHSFIGADGGYPLAGLIQGIDGNLYGTTQYGGSGNCQDSFTTGCGTIFKITPDGALTSLHSFNATDGDTPSVLIGGSDGTLYGIAQYGGTGGCQSGGCGTVFKLTPGGTFTTLYQFEIGFSNPTTLLLANDGNLYGTTMYANSPCSGCNALFKLTPTGSFTILYVFVGLAPNSLIQAADGNLYGSSAVNGANGFGAVFEFPVASPDAPAIAATGGVLNGASFQPGISADSWITINGTNLSSKTDTWDNSIMKGELPAMLDGVSVVVSGQPAYIEYVSPTQINAVAPNVPPGSISVTVTNSNGTSQSAMAQLSAEQPAFFQWGKYAVATRQDFSLAVKNGTFPGTTTVPAKPGDVIILWGTGFGPTSPSAPAAVETPSNATYNTATPVSVTIGGKPANVFGAALAPGYAGLYQIAIQIPASLANGDYPVVATIDGASSPSTTMITVQP